MASSGFMKILGVAGLAAAAWYIFDPNKGPARRKMIADTAKDLYDEAGHELGRVSGELGRVGNDLMTGVNDLVGRVSEMTGMTAGGSSSGSHSSSHTNGSHRSA